MAPHPRVLPWFSWDEWHQVMQGLFAPDHIPRPQKDKKRGRDKSENGGEMEEEEWRAYAQAQAQQVWALEVVGLWRLRSRVPHSVDSTAQLVEALLNDSNAEATYRVGTFQRSETELRLSFSIIIVRAVNGLVDPSQQGYFADSVASLAQRIGLPGWFVELRHDATHQQLPSLTMLRTAARHLVTWYHDNYWEPQREFLQLQAESLTTLACAKHEGGIGIQKQSSFDSGSVEDSLGPAAKTDLLFLKETTFLTSIFIPELLRSLFSAVHSESGGAEQVQQEVVHRVQERQEEQWGGVLATVLKQSAHSAVGAANTLVCHLVATAAELQFEGEGRGGVVVMLLDWWVRRVMRTLKDVLAASLSNSRQSSSVDEAPTASSPSSFLHTLTSNLQQLDKSPLHPPYIRPPSGQSLPMSSCMPTACARGLRMLSIVHTATNTTTATVTSAAAECRRLENRKEEREGFISLVNTALVIYGDALFQAVCTILIDEKVAFPPFTSVSPPESSFSGLGKRTFSANNMLTVQTKRLTSMKYASEYEAHRQRAWEGSNRGNIMGCEVISPAVSEEGAIDIMDMKEWLDSPVKQEGGREGGKYGMMGEVANTGTRGEDSPQPPNAVAAAERRAELMASRRVAWPLGVPVGCTRHQGSLLYLLEEC